VDAFDIGIDLDGWVTNIEGEAITWTYDATPGVVDVLVMNSAGFLYVGYALRDCLKAVPLPYLEIHVTNIERREMKSVIAI
jgi:3-dehydroquinate dehydratase-2